MKVGIINVGVNASHNIMSPIFDDCTFEFVPIPAQIEIEEDLVFPKYEELVSPNGREFAEFMPQQFLEMRTHNDPEFVTFTYGDFPTRSPRASNLMQLKPGDQLFFLARLVNWRNGGFTHQAGFYLIGFLDIEHVFDENELTAMVESRRFDDQFKKIKRNGHMLMAQKFPELWLDAHIGWKGSWVFLGSKNSRRFKYAIPFNRALADEIMFDALGNKWTWPENQTELQRIGSYTRSCRIIKDELRIDRLWKAIQRITSL